MWQKRIWREIEKREKSSLKQLVRYRYYGFLKEESRSCEKIKEREKRREEVRRELMVMGITPIAVISRKKFEKITRQLRFYRFDYLNEAGETRVPLTPLKWWKIVSGEWSNDSIIGIRIRVKFRSHSCPLSLGLKTFCTPSIASQIGAMEIEIIPDCLFLKFLKLVKILKNRRKKGQKEKVEEGCILIYINFSFPIEDFIAVTEVLLV